MSHRDAERLIETGGCTPQEEVFARLVAVLRNKTEAYRRAYNVKPTTSRAVLSSTASTVSQREHVAARIKYYNDLAAKAAVANLTEVVRDWLDIATADPDEIVSHRVGCCRYCHGDGFQYQWRDPMEYARAIADAVSSHDPKKGELRLPDDLGGYGFKANTEPFEDCPRCDGRGVPYVVIADTGKLTGPAKRLYAGVKQTRNGIEVMLRDQDKALDSLARHLGAYNDSLDVKGRLAMMGAGTVSEALTDDQRANLERFFSDTY